MLIDPKLFYRHQVMDMLSDNHLYITDNLDHIIFEKDVRKVIFRMFSNKMEYYIDGEQKVVYDVGKLLIIFAIKRALVENYLA